MREQSIAPKVKAVTPRSTVQVSKAEYGSDVIVDLMRAFDIEYAAFNPGASFRELHDSIVNYGGNKKPEVIEVTHEEISVAIAHGYAKAAGKPMVAIAHDIVGLQHASMAIFNAWCDRVPVIVLGGTGPMDVTARRPWIDWIHTALVQGNLVRDFAKWDDQPQNLASVPESFVRAYHVATQEPTGPVYICYDWELQGQRLHEPFVLPDVRQYALPTPVQADPTALRQLAEWLVGAERPVILVEYLGRHPETVPVLVELAELLGIPVLDRAGRMNFPSNHPLDVTGANREYLEQADLILGLDVNDLFGALTVRDRETHKSQTFVRDDAKIVHISVKDVFIRSWANDFQRMPATDLNITADTQVAVPALLGLCKELLGKDSGRRDQIQKRTAQTKVRHDQIRAASKATAARQTEERPVAPSKLAADIWEAIKGEDWVLASGSLGGWARRLWDWTIPNQYLGHSAGGGLGYGMGASIGAALAYRGTDKLIVNIQSDGDFLFTPGALWTAAHHQVPMLVVMYNNRSYYNSEEHAQAVARVRGRPIENAPIGTAIVDPNVDFAALTRSFNLYGEGPIEDPDEILPALQRALRVVKEERRLALVDVVCGNDNRGR